MFEKQVAQVQEKLSEAITLAKTDLDAGLKALADLSKEVGTIIPMESTEYYEMASFVFEAMADFYVHAKKPVEAEENLKEMLRCSSELLKRDEEKYDYRYAVAYYKLGTLGKLCLDMVDVPATPRTLTEKENDIFKIIITYFKMAMKATLEKAKKGLIKSIEMQAICLDQMAVMHGTVGNYKDAIEDESRSIQLEKAIYENRDDLGHSMMLAFRMNNLAMFYNQIKDYAHAIETLEDSIYVLEEKLQEDPKKVKIVLGRHQMNLANAYACVKEQMEEAPIMFRRAVATIEEANTLCDDLYLPDIVLANFYAGKYFYSIHLPEDARHYLTVSIEANQKFNDITGSDQLKKYHEQAYTMIMSLPQ